MFLTSPPANSPSHISAISSYEASLEYDPENQQIRDTIAHAYIMLAKQYGESDEAIEAYQNSMLYKIDK